MLANLKLKFLDFQCQISRETLNVLLSVSMAQSTYHEVLVTRSADGVPQY
jgi:hypothetical protein